MKTMIMTFLVIYSISNSPKEIKGKITDRSTSENLAGVRVIINKTDTTYTDFNGNFNMLNIDTLKRIDLSYPSYTSDGIMLVKNNEIIANIK